MSGRRMYLGVAGTRVRRSAAARGQRARMPVRACAPDLAAADEDVLKLGHATVLCTARSHQRVPTALPRGLLLASACARQAANPNPQAGSLCRKARTRPVTVMSFIWLFQLSSDSTSVPRYVSPVLSSTCQKRKAMQAVRRVATGRLLTRARRARRTVTTWPSPGGAAQSGVSAVDWMRSASRHASAPSCSSRSGTPTPCSTRRHGVVRCSTPRGCGSPTRDAPCSTWRRAGAAGPAGAAEPRCFTAQPGVLRERKRRFARQA